MDAVDRYMLVVDVRIARALLLMDEWASARAWDWRHAPSGVHTASLRLRDPGRVLRHAQDAVVASMQRLHRAERVLLMAEEGDDAGDPEWEWRPWRYIEGWSAGRRCDRVDGCLLVEGHPGVCPVG